MVLSKIPFASELVTIFNTLYSIVFQMKESDLEVEKWDHSQVCEWLKKNGFNKYTHLVKEHNLDGSVLLMMKESDLRQPPIQLNVLGDIKKLWKCILELQESTYGMNKNRSLHDSVDGLHFNSCSTPRHRIQRPFSSESAVSDDEDGELIEEEVSRFVRMEGRYTQSVEPEIFKTLLSFIYCFIVFLLTSFIMTVVHDRVPDPKKYPPLPDLFLDNMPYVPWAFEVCEMIGIVMFSIWTVILIFHKHRFVYCCS